MQQSKLIALLRTFEARDFRRFGEYLASPFFNKREDLQEFYTALKAFAPDFPAAQLNKVSLWEQYTAWQPLNEKELGYLMNFLLQHAENYLAIEAFEGDVTAKGRRSMTHFLVHGLEKHYKSTAQRSLKALEAESSRDAEWHLKAWRLADLEIQHFYSAKSRIQDASHDKASRHLDAFFLDKKLEMGSEAINLSHILQGEVDWEAIDRLIDFADGMPENLPNVRIRRLVASLLQHPEDDSAFRALKQLLPEVKQVFSPEKAKGVFSYAQNYCIRRIKAGETAFQQELLQIYQTSIDAGLIYQGQYLSPWSFKNVCSVALKLGEYDWAAQFTREQAERVAPSFRSNGVAYNLANLHFHQGNLEQAMRGLSKVGFQDVFYALDTRRMMLMVYFERGDFESFFSLISSFRTYLRRNKVVSVQNRKAYKNFVDWLARIFRAQQKGDRRILEKYGNELAQIAPIVEREWLLGKCR